MLQYSVYFFPLSHILLIIHKGPIIVPIIVQIDLLSEILAFGIDFISSCLILSTCVKILFHSKSKLRK